MTSEIVLPRQVTEDKLREINLKSITSTKEEIFRDGAEPAHSGIVQISATAIIQNPWNGFRENLAPEVEKIAPILAQVLCERVLQHSVGSAAIEAFGKAAVVGQDGELEHAAALIHTSYFGELVREYLAGTSILCFTDGRFSNETSIRVPAWHKTEATKRAYYQTVEVPLNCPLGSQELAVIVVASTGPRPHARIGDRLTDAPVSSKQFN